MKFNKAIILSLLCLLITLPCFNNRKVKTKGPVFEFTRANVFPITDQQVDDTIIDAAQPGCIPTKKGRPYTLASGQLKTYAADHHIIPQNWLRTNLRAALKSVNTGTEAQKDAVVAALNAFKNTLLPTAQQCLNA